MNEVEANLVLYCRYIAHSFNQQQQVRDLESLALPNRQTRLFRTRR